MSLALLAGCAGSDPAPRQPSPRLAAEHRPAATGRGAPSGSRSAVTNRTHEQVTDRVDRPAGARLRRRRGPGQERAAPGGAARQPADAVRRGDAAPRTGPRRWAGPRVVVRVHTESDPTSRREVLRPTDPDGLLPRVAASTCQSQRLLREVELSFGPDWRLVGSGRDRYLRGTLDARLTIDQPRDVTQLRGTVIFDLLPTRRAGRAPADRPPHPRAADRRDPGPADPGPVHRARPGRDQEAVRVPGLAGPAGRRGAGRDTPGDRRCEGRV